jgi:hypothetical protein
VTELVKTLEGLDPERAGLLIQEAVQKDPTLRAAGPGKVKEVLRQIIAETRATAERTLKLANFQSEIVERLEPGQAFADAFTEEDLKALAREHGLTDEDFAEDMRSRGIAWTQ